MDSINSLPPARDSQMQAMLNSKKQIEFPPFPQEAQAPQPAAEPQTQQNPTDFFSFAQPQVEQELVAQEAPEQVEQPQQETQPIEQPEPEVDKIAKSLGRKTPAESIRDIKAKAERAERERDDLARKLREYEESRRYATQPQESSPEEDLSLNIGQEDLVEGKHISKVDKKIQKLEEKLRAYEQQSSITQTEQKLKSQYQDFDKVVSKENLEVLQYTYPELFNTIRASQDLYNNAVSAYTMIKRLGIYQEYDYAAEKARVQANVSKPKLSPAAAAQQADSPLSKANAFAQGLTPELQQQLRKEMMEARRVL